MHDTLPSPLLLSIAFSLVLTAGGCDPAVSTFDHAHEIPAGSIAEIPPNATDITVQYGSGQHTATFSDTTDDLTSWVERMRNLKPGLNASPDSPNWLDGANDYLRPTLIDQERSTFNLRMGISTGFTDRMLKFTIVRSARGGTTVIWHDPETASNYLWAVYH